MYITNVLLATRKAECYHAASMGTEKRIRSYVPWKSSEVVLGIVVMSLVTLGIVLPINSVVVDESWSIGLRIVVVSGILGLTMLVISLLLGPVRYRVSLATLGLGRLPSQPSQLFLLPSLVLVVSLVFNILYVSLVTTSGLEELKPPSLPPSLGFHGSAVVVGFLLLVIWGPLTEEVFFRGFVFAGSVHWLGPTGAVFFSAFLFALAHMFVGMIIPALFTGILLAWLYYKTQSLWASFIAHAAQNTLAFLSSAIT